MRSAQRRRFGLFVVNTLAKSLVWAVFLCPIYFCAAWLVTRLWPNGLHFSQREILLFFICLWFANDVKKAIRQEWQKYKSPSATRYSGPYPKKIEV